MMTRFLTLIVTGISFSVFLASGQNSSSSNSEAAVRKLSLAAKAVSGLYVDKVDENALTEAAIRGMLEDLDPHSAYMTIEEVKELNEPLQGNFDGIGIQFNMLNDTLYVLQTISGGPSERVGIRAGDRIVAVNDTTIAGVKMINKEIMRRLRGAKGTKVLVTVLRRGLPEPILFRITRDKIPISSIDAAYRINKEIGYIRISRFGATTLEEFEKALVQLQKEGIRDLIIDLQGNGGGYLNAAIALADEFLDNNKLIVYTQGRRSPREEAHATKEGLFQKGRVVVLVDESSASASEILAGALQDWDRGVIVGRRSFGKGLVQRPIPFPDGSMMRLTVSRYYTPSGRSIQRPYDEGRDKYDQELITRYNRGELQHADSIHFPDSLQYKTLLQGRTVYGGGGIMPDVFIPIDTTRYSNYHRDLVAKGVLNTFAIEQVDAERTKLLKEYPSLEKFAAKYAVSEEIMKRLTQKAAQEGVPFQADQYERAAPLLRVQLKALMARDLYGEGAYFRLINPLNDGYLRAIELLQDGKEYQQLLHP